MSYYQPQPQQNYAQDPRRLLVMEKLTTGLALATGTSVAMIFFDLPPIFMILAIIGFIISIIGYFFAKNEDTINSLYYIFVGSSSVFLGYSLQAIAAIDGGAEIIMGTFGLTGIVVGFTYYKAEVNRPDTYALGRKLMPYSLAFIALIILSWFFVTGGFIFLLISVFGAALFTMYLYWDLARVMQGQYTSPARMAWSIYWDILLIFRYILRIVSYFARR